MLAHEDDVRIARWRGEIRPDSRRDEGPRPVEGQEGPGAEAAASGGTSEQYWNEAQFQKLVAAPAGKLHSRGPLPWRLLAYMLDASPEMDLIRSLVGKRLMDSRHIEAGQRELDRMLLIAASRPATCRWSRSRRRRGSRAAAAAPNSAVGGQGCWNSSRFGPAAAAGRRAEPPPYRPMLAHPTPNWPS